MQYTIAKSEELHRLLWSQTVLLIKNSSPSVVTGLFIQSLNEVLDLNRTRVTEGLYNRLPGTVFIALYFVAFLSITLMGFQAGLTGSRTPIASVALIMALAAILMLIIDLNRLTQSIFDVSHRAMIDLSSKINPS